MAAAAADFIPVFVDTLDESKPWKRFDESWGSYPVLRIHDHDGRDLAGRLDGNPLAGKIPVDDVLDQLARGLEAWRRR